MPQRFTGKCVTWKDKGFGFVQGDDGSEHFVHFSALQMEKDAFRMLSVGQEVEFELSDNNGHTRAENVTAKDGRPLPDLRKTVDHGSRSAVAVPPLDLTGSPTQTRAASTSSPPGNPPTSNPTQVDFALHAAVKALSLEAVQSLLEEESCDVNARDCDRCTALDRVLEKEPSEPHRVVVFQIAVELIKHGAHVNESLLHAATKRRAHAVDFLLDNGANIEFQDEHGRTPLMLAMLANPIDLSLVHILLYRGAQAACAGVTLASGGLSVLGRVAQNVMYGPRDLLEGIQLMLCFGANPGNTKDARDVAEAIQRLSLQRGTHRFFGQPVANQFSLSETECAELDGISQFVRSMRQYGFVKSTMQKWSRDVAALDRQRVATAAKMRQEMETAMQQTIRDEVRHETEESEAEAALLAKLGEIESVMSAPDGWAAPRPVDRAAQAHVLIDAFIRARQSLTSLLEKANAGGSPADVLAASRAECCATATALLHHLPAMSRAPNTSDSDDDAEPCCVTGIDALPPRPPDALIHELATVSAEAKTEYDAAVMTLTQVVTDGQNTRPIAATINAALKAHDSCKEWATRLESKWTEARDALPAAPLALSPEECGRHRLATEAVLKTESPWAGRDGLRRRTAAIEELESLTTRRTVAAKSAKRATRAVSIATNTLAVAQSDSDEDDDAVDEAKAALSNAEAQRDAALPALLAATTAVQDWATSGEGALALKAFPGDAELTEALAGLLSSDFSAQTALPQTPSVNLDEEYHGRYEVVPGVIYFAERLSTTKDQPPKPVVLRRLPLGPTEMVETAKRQLRDAGQLAVGLQACTGSAEQCPPVVVATRWFVAKNSGGSSDVWLEFPRANGGTLAEALQHGDGALSAAAATDLCCRLVRAVAHLHAAGIRHGDLNPSNIVLWDTLGPEVSVVRPGIIDLLDTMNVGATRTLRGSTLEWLPPEAVEALTRGDKAVGTRALDCWQLGKVCSAVLDAATPSETLISPVQASIVPLSVDQPDDRCSAADALVKIETTLSDANAAAVKTAASLRWVLPPQSWLCQRAMAPGVDFVRLDQTSDVAARILVACTTAIRRRVRAIFRLENVRLWHVYAAERARVKEETNHRASPCPRRLTAETCSQMFNGVVGGAAAAVATLTGEAQPAGSNGEALLLHGADQRSHQLIAEGGLDPSYSGGRVGALFGAATCLTPLWAKAANEYARSAGDGVFVTRAAIGRVADCLNTPRAETSQFRRPPDGHHSVLGDNGTPGAVVAVYRPSRMYPEYLVVFDDAA